MRVAERVVLGLGLLLRLLLPFTFLAHDGFDYGFHYPYVEWFIDHHGLPPASLSREVFHPPAYYFLAGWWMRHGATHQTLVWLSALSGCVRLIVIFWGLRSFFRDRPLLRVVALGAAALIPSAVHIDGVMNAESLHATLATCALLFILLAIQRRRWIYAPLAGFFLGLALLTKVTAVVLVVAMLFAAMLYVIDARRWQAALPWLGALAITLAISGWYYQRNIRLWHTPFPTSFDTTEQELMAKARALPKWRRRPLDFYWRWQTAYYTRPCAIEREQSYARFWPTLVVTTFTDFYNYGFAPSSEPAVRCNYRMMRASALQSARISFAGGTVIALAVLLAWLALLRTLDSTWLVALSVPAFAVLALLRFAVVYPLDEMGVIKGHYLHWAAAPLYVLTGVAFEYAWRRRRALAWILLLAFMMVAQYTLYARGLALFAKLIG